MEETGINLFSKKNIITFLLIGIMLAAIPVAVKLAQEQQQLQSKASAGANVSFMTSSTLKQDSSGNFVTTSPNINVRVGSPFGSGQ